MRLEELLEEDLRTLKETDFMGPTTRAEFNRRKLLAASPEEEGNLRKKEGKFDFSKFDDILQERKSDQLKNARTKFGG
jgi:hypothetical protein